MARDGAIFSLRYKINITALTYSLLFTFFLQPLAYAALPAVKLYFDAQEVLQDIQPLAQTEGELKNFKVRVLDSQGKPVRGSKVVWEITNDKAKLVTPSPETNPDGESSVKVRMPLQSTAVLTAKLNTQRKNFRIIESKQYKFLNPDRPTIENPNAEANGVDATIVTSRVINQLSGVPDRGAIVHWQLINNTADAVLNRKQSISNKNGDVSIKVFATRAGTATLQARIINGTDSESTTNFDTQLNFKQGQNLGLNSLVKHPQRMGISNSYIITVTATVDQTTAKPDPKQKIFWQLQDEENIGASFTTTPSVHNLKRVTSSADISSTKPGSVGIIATIYNTEDSSKVQRRKVYVDFSSTHNMEPLTAINHKTTAEANGIDQVSLTTRIYNQDGTGVKGKKILWHFISNTANAYATYKTTTTDEYGESILNIQASQAGSVMVKANSLGILMPEELPPKLITFVKNHNTGLTDLTLNKSIARGDNSDRVTATATLVDDIGQPTKQPRKVIWTLEGNNIDAQVMPTESFTNPQGQATTTVTATMEGYVTVVATAAKTNQPNKKESFKTRAYFTNEANIELLTASPRTVMINRNHTTLSAQVGDQNGRKLVRQAVVWSLENIGDTQAHFIDLPDDNISFSTPSGTATAKLKALKPGTVTAVATIVGQPESRPQLSKIKDVEIRFIDQPKQLTLTPSNYGPIEADGKKTAFITARLSATEQEDIIGQKIQWFLASEDTNAQLLNLDGNNINTTSSDGTATVYLLATTKGKATVTARLIKANPTANDPTVEGDLPLIFKKTVASLHINVDNNTPLLGETSKASVTLMTPYNEPIANARIYWDLGNQTNSLISHTSGLTTDHHGVAWIQYRSTQPTSFLVKASARHESLDNELLNLSSIIEFQSYKIDSLTSNPESTDALKPGSAPVVFTAVLKTVSNNHLPARLVSGKQISFTWKDSTNPPDIKFRNTESRNDGKIIFEIRSDKETTNTFEIQALGGAQEKTTRDITYKN